MFRKLLATTAIAALMTAGALAQDEQQSPESMNKPLFNTAQGAGMDSETGFFEADASQILASDLLGMTVYNGSTDEAESVGEINDVVMGPGGNAEAVVIGVGGFLGIGEKEVAVDFAKISWIDRDGSRWLILDSSKEELEGAPEFDRASFEPEPAEQTAATDDTTDMMAADPAMEEGADTAANEEQSATMDEQSSDMAASEDEPAPGQADTAEAEQPAATEEEASDMAAGEEPASMDAEQTAEATNEEVDPAETAAIDPNSWTPVTNALSAEEVIGTRVYGANDEDIGEIGDVIVTADGNFEAYVVDVGGFLGIGEKPVALGAEELEILQDGDGGFHIRTAFTAEQLEGQPAYDENAYNDEMILR
jgi:sporulation protein YlmC with PRC-barrel domain